MFACVGFFFWVGGLLKSVHRRAMMQPQETNAFTLGARRVCAPPTIPGISNCKGCEFLRSLNWVYPRQLQRTCVCVCVVGYLA